MKDISQNSDLVRGLLARDLAARCARNPRYSLRSYARSLGISHALLSLVMNGKREPSAALTAKLAGALELKPEESARLRGAQKRPEPIAGKIDDHCIRLSLDTFSLISDWHFYAILSLLEIPGAKWTAPWIAERLGIMEAQAIAAMKLLEDLSLVEKRKNGRWKQVNKPIKVENTTSTEFTRKAHRQLLQKARESLDNDPMEERDFSYCTFAMSEENVAYALREIRKFRVGLMKKLETRGRPNRVYELCVQLFPVSKGASK